MKSLLQSVHHYTAGSTAIVLALTLLAPQTISAAQSEPAQRASLESQSQVALSEFVDSRPEIRALLEQAHGYAVFPRVNKGGAVVGAAHGDGLVYEGGKVVGSTSLTQITIGLELGGAVYSQLVVFHDEQTTARFKSEKIRFTAQAMGAAGHSGNGAQYGPDKGLSVYVLTRTGGLVQASLGGQRFTFTPSAS